MKRLYFAVFGVFAIFGAVAFSEACSSSSSTDAASTSDAASGATGETGASTTELPTCGAPPYVTLSLSVETASAADAATRIGGAILTSPLCPDASFTSDDDGGIVGLVTQNTAFYGRFNAAGYAPTLSPEEFFDASLPTVAIALPPSLLTVIVPNYDKTKPLVLVDARLDTGTNHDGGANCDDPSDIAFSVDGHPEAVVTYYTSGSIPSAIPGATGTSEAGLASITGIDVSISPISITGTKTGCTVSFVKNGSTGEIPLENAYVSIAAAYLRD
jgi:hypothetical protein